MGDMFSRYLKASTCGNEKMSSSLSDANGKTMTRGGQISKKLWKPFLLPDYFVLLSFPALTCLLSHLQHQKRKKKKTLSPRQKMKAASFNSSFL